MIIPDTSANTETDIGWFSIIMTVLLLKCAVTV